MKSIREPRFYAQKCFADLERKANIIQLFLDGMKPMEIAKQNGYTTNVVYTVLYKEKLLKKKRDS